MDFSEVGKFVVMSIIRVNCSGKYIYIYIK